jgi:hypothetical protein
METVVSPSFGEALVKMQGALAGAKKNRNAFKYNYADLAECWEACEEALQSNNLVLLQLTDRADHGYVGLKSVLIYAPTGECITAYGQIPVKDPSDPQAAGSGYTYLRRYQLCAMLGIRTEDDDGSAARQQPKPAPKPVDMSKLRTELDALLAEGHTVTLAELSSLHTKVKNTPDSPERTKLLEDVKSAGKAVRAAAATPGTENK